MRKLSLSIPHRTCPVSSCETWLADMWCCRQLASRKRRCNTLARPAARCPTLPGALRARRRDRRTKGLHLSLGCAAWPGARDVLNKARTHFNEPVSDGGEVRLVEGLVSGMVQGAECNPGEGLVLGAVTNAPLGRFTRITPTS